MLPGGCREALGREGEGGAQNRRAERVDIKLNFSLLYSWARPEPERASGGSYTSECKLVFQVNNLFTFHASLPILGQSISKIENKF